ncbi:hypothetical protein ACFQT0_23015 [Hymenobacter humi]|uniref:TonB-dependent receptor n=1 Tax=Hymenobacter humi TaxID=1411620 RepID=A0ABW2U8S0_9BACT
MLGGMTLERHTFRGTGFNPDYDQPTGSVAFDRRSSNNRYLLTTGASVRYQLRPRFEPAVHGHRQHRHQELSAIDYFFGPRCALPLRAPLSQPENQPGKSGPMLFAAK